MAIYSGFSHRKLPFSIAMLVYQRVLHSGQKTSSATRKTPKRPPDNTRVTFSFRRGGPFSAKAPAKRRTASAAFMGPFPLEMGGLPQKPWLSMRKSANFCDHLLENFWVAGGILMNWLDDLGVPNLKTASYFSRIFPLPYEPRRNRKPRVSTLPCRKDGLMHPSFHGHSPRPSIELCFFSLLNCNTQIRTPTRGLRKPLLPSKTAYARVTFQEVPTRLPTRKMLQRSLYLTWCGHKNNSGSEEEYKELEDDDSLGDLWKEGRSLIKTGAQCHDVILNHDELMETLEKWNCKTLMGYGPQFDLGPPHFLREGLRGAYAKIRTENCCSKTWHL